MPSKYEDIRDLKRSLINDLYSKLDIAYIRGYEKGFNDGIFEGKITDSLKDKNKKECKNCKHYKDTTICVGCNNRWNLGFPKSRNNDYFELKEEENVKEQALQSTDNTET